MKKSFNLGLIILFYLFVGCASKKEYLVKIETRHGDMYAVFFDQTPQHKANFLSLAKAGRFDSTQFHRVIKDFMIQGGDVFGKEEILPEKWPTIPAEINREFFHSKGMIAAARQGNNINPDRRSNGSQFYIVQGRVYGQDELVTDMKLLSEKFYEFIQLDNNAALKETYLQLYNEQQFDSLNVIMISQKKNLEDFFSINLEKPMTQEQVKAYTSIGGTPHLDGEYTVFGKVVKGSDVIEKIANEPRGDRDVPLNPVYIKMSVERLSRPKILKRHGYVFEE